MRLEMPVKGGMLVLVENGGKVSWEYSGTISREYAKELVANTPAEFMPTVNGMPMRDWLDQVL